MHKRIETAPNAPPVDATPDLRADYDALERAAAQHPEAAPLLGELDEIVDAVNSLAALVGLDSSGGSPDASDRARRPDRKPTAGAR